ncbi:MAG: ATP-binding cassette domain-containing protein [Methanobacterium sp.]|uniref:ABC transporter ATP-binding protein n=1 Tax=Methanobacterium sp. TaxID=2164 RepID=UPI003C77C7ED
MRQIRSIDLGLIFLFTLIFLFAISNFRKGNIFNYGLEISFIILLSLFSGYSLVALLKPADNFKSILKNYPLILGFAVLLIVVNVAIFTISSLGFHIRYLIMGLSVPSLIFTLAAFIRRLLYGINETIENFESHMPDEDLKHKEYVAKNIIPEAVIKVIDVSMEFNLSQEKIDNIKEYVIKFLKRELFYQEFWALKNINFQVEKGEKLGVVGLNGAGKSTLLKLISGVMKPTEGKIELKGSLVPLLELGAGFDPDYTGRENIFLNGALLGYSKEFIESKFDEIVEFSELQKFIDVPVKNYSSGMVARLGFSIATIIEPRILILDEVLAVGDAKFKAKSEERMKSFLNKDVTVLFVSHSIEQVKSLCTRAIWLEKGKLIMEGPVEEVCDRYMESTGVNKDTQITQI